MSLPSPESPVAIDLGAIAKALNLPPPRVEAAVKLLDEGNTVPFITRYRKDQTGGLDEDAVRAIHDRVTKQRQLAERKQTILRSIDSQGKLTPELAKAIEAAQTARRLEDLYLPYKPKKQTLATTARSRGLEPLALEILAADPLAADLDARLRDFVNSDKQVPTAADALLGAGHILAELFSERADFRGRVRSILERSGKLVTTAVEPEVKPGEKSSEKGAEKAADKSSEKAKQQADAAAQPLFAGLVDEGPATASAAQGDSEGDAEQSEAFIADAVADVETPHFDAEESPEELQASDMEEEGAHVDPAEPPVDTAVPVTGAATSEDGAAVMQPAVVDSPLASTPETAALPGAAVGQKPPKKKKEKKPKKILTKAERRAAELHRAFRDYFQFAESVSKLPPHRVLAINRGEKAKILRVRIEADAAAMERVVDELLVPAGHPHADFLRGCGRDALHRLVLPSLERELRRESTDEAETHAVEVFAKNLRNLLLQPPVRERRLLALDPGFKSGCKWVALDEFGNLLEHGVVFIVGNAERRAGSKAKLLEVVKEKQLSVVVIGNGTACRETETFVAELISTDLAGAGVSYVIVSEAGASVYSASPLGRAEFPDRDATVRGAVSIGRRLQDPLSELVKIEPNSLGVGLYQHDVKAKHLRDSLDGVVESCVNYVGVDLNTASPSLLRYVSGLNQLTAQRIYDHRMQNGPFKTREQLKEVSGVGDAAFVQAAGFLRISGGDQPLDGTWIHPESYETAERVLEQLGAKPTDLADKDSLAKITEKSRGIDLQRMALQLRVGTLSLHDIITQLTRPGRDPRDSLPPPIFKQGILKLDDLQPGMELRGTVLNVVDFGAFVDIGLKDSGLVHISHLADKYVKDPHEVVSVGDVVKVWVLQVDKQRRRVSLTMIPPGAKRTEERRDAGSAEGERRSGDRPRGGQGQREGAGSREGSRGAGRGGFQGGGGRQGSGGQGGPGQGGGRREGAPQGAGQGGRGGDGGRRFGGKPEGGGRGGRRPSRRDDEPSADVAAAEAILEEAKKKAPPPPPPKLTKAKVQGRAYLQSFGELKQFINVTAPESAAPQPAPQTTEPPTAQAPTPITPAKTEPPGAAATPAPAEAKTSPEGGSSA
ncbi:MAG: RNA-binding transcriptional accessory protein [Planctomycetaceae bacterium]|nr:RNA-binding transcriptional accessory protein [Planctomycetaceae bacterium]